MTDMPTDKNPKTERPSLTVVEGNRDQLEESLVQAFSDADFDAVDALWGRLRHRASLRDSKE